MPDPAKNKQSKSIKNATGGQLEDATNKEHDHEVEDNATSGEESESDVVDKKTGKAATK